MKHLHRLLLAVALVLPRAVGAAYPDKPINLIVGYSPGGGTDLIAAAADAEFQARATSVFAPLRFLTPAQFEQVIREAEVGFKQLWKELPWGDK